MPCHEGGRFRRRCRSSGRYQCVLSVGANLYARLHPGDAEGALLDFPAISTTCADTRKVCELPSFWRAGRPRFCPHHVDQIA